MPGLPGAVHEVRRGVPQQGEHHRAGAGGFRDEFQIVHIDAFCNECGNCATFCPWEGQAVQGQAHGLRHRGRLHGQHEPRLLPQRRRGEDPRRRHGRAAVRVDGVAERDRARSATVQRSRVVQAIVRDYRYLLGGALMIVLKNATVVHLHPAEVTPGVDIVIDGTEIQAVGRAAGGGAEAGAQHRPCRPAGHAGPRLRPRPLLLGSLPRDHGADRPVPRFRLHAAEPLVAPGPRPRRGQPCG